MDNENQNTPSKKEQEKEQANEGIKEGAKLAAKAYTGGQGGPLIDAAVDKIADSKAGQAAMNKINNNRMARKAFSKAAPAAKTANNAMNLKSGGGQESIAGGMNDSETSSNGATSLNLFNIGGKGDKKKTAKLVLGLSGCIVPIASIILIPVLIIAIIMAIIGPIGKAMDSVNDFKDKSQELWEKWGNFFKGDGFNTDEEEFYKQINKINEKKKQDYNITIDVPLLMATLTYYNNVSNETLEINDEKNKDIDFDGLKGDIEKLADAMINHRQVTITKTNDDGTTSTREVTEYYLDTTEDPNKYKTYLFDVYFEKKPINKLLNGYSNEEDRNRKKEEMYQEILSFIELYKDFYSKDSITGGFICGAISPISDDSKNGEFNITSPYGNRLDPLGSGRTKFHAGIDMVPASGAGTANIVSVADGTIESIIPVCGEPSIIVNHGSFKTRYVHLKTVSVSEGDSVTKGQIIGKMGGNPGESTCSTGSHLHFEYYSDGVNHSNPQELLDNLNINDDTCEKMLNGGNIFVKIDSNANNENGAICPPNSKFGGDNVCSLETYILGVVTAEHAGAPVESLKAQAIASRTYFLNRILRSNSYVETTTSDGQTVKVATIESSQRVQVFNINKYNTLPNDKKNNILNAVTETAGKVLVNNGKIFSTQYSSCSPSLIKTRQPTNNTVNANCTRREGHAYGMAQLGADNFAFAGKDYVYILNYYYDGQIVDFSEEVL